MGTPDIPHSRPWITAHEQETLDERLRSGMISEGGEAARIAHELASRFGCAGGRTLASGTSGIAGALLAVGVGAGDDVLLPAYCCDDVTSAIRLAGARPVLADLTPGRWTSGPREYERVRTPSAKAIVAVRTFGHPVDAAGLAAIGIPVIEDACHTPAPPDPASAFTVFSFHATKSLTSGEGGFVGSPDPAKVSALDAGACADLCRSAPMSDLGASLLGTQLERWDEMAARRGELLERYLDALPEHWTAPLRAVIDGSPPFVHFRLPLEIASGSDALIAHAAARGVHLRRGVDQLLHRSDPSCLAPPMGCPEAERRLETTVSLPFYPSLSDDDAARVIGTLLDAHREGITDG